MTRITVPFSGATTALDNLASVAINVSLLAATTNSIDLGSTAKYWNNAYITTVNLSSTSTVSATNVTLVGTNPGGIFKNTSAGQFTTAGFYMYHTTSSMGNFAGVHIATNILDGSATTGNFAIDAVDYTGAYVKTYLNFALNDSVIQFIQQAYFVGNVGFFNTWPSSKQTVTGLKAGNAALGSLLTALATYGLIIDSSGT